MAMSNERPIIFDGEIHRIMTDAEYADWLQVLEQLENQENAMQIRAEKRASVISKLGLTAEEAAALLG